MKTHHNFLAIAVIAALGFGMVRPTASLAGDQEWAVAGKILTGVLATKLLYDAHDWRRSRECRTDVSSYWRPDVDYRPGKYYFRSTRCDRDRRDYGCPSRKDYYEKSCSLYQKERGWSSLRDDDYVIVCIDDGRRIVQPKVQGAKAYLQVYSDLCAKWVTLREYPPIW